MEHYISVYWNYWLLQTFIKRRVKLSLPTAVWCLYDCSIPHRSLVKNKWRGLVFILLYVAYKRGHSVFDNAVKTTVLYIQQIDLMTLSHRLVKLTKCRRCLALDTLSSMCVSKRSLLSFAALRYWPLVLGVITVPSRESCSILCLLPMCTPDTAISIGLSFRPTFETGRQTRAFKRDKSGQGRTVG